jgi:Domain of unknown function (DUF4160)
MGACSATGAAKRSRPVLEAAEGRWHAPVSEPVRVIYRRSPGDPCYGPLVPVVLSIEGFRFFFFSNEASEPPHIHVERGEGYAKFWLDPVELAETKYLKNQELKRARMLVIEHRESFLGKWHEYFSTAGT